MNKVIVVQFMNVTPSMHKNGYYTWQKQSENIELDLKRYEEFTCIYKNLANYCLILTRN